MLSPIPSRAGARALGHEHMCTSTTQITVDTHDSRSSARVACVHLVFRKSITTTNTKCCRVSMANFAGKIRAQYRTPATPPRAAQSRSVRLFYQSFSFSNNFLSFIPFLRFLSLPPPHASKLSHHRSSTRNAARRGHMPCSAYTRHVPWMRHILLVECTCKCVRLRAIAAR